MITITEYTLFKKGQQMIVDYEKKPVGTILKNLRVENGFSLRALAKEFGIDHSNIYIWEKRNETPTQQMLEKYHKFFNVSYEYLLGETDEPTSTEIGKTRFETEEDYALKRLAEENPRCFNTLSYLLRSPSVNSSNSICP